jgi:two-component system chemotaxis sensor kinase CheA
LSSPGAGGWISQDQLAPIKVQFFQECVEHLAELESGLIALEQGETDPEIINTVFRAAHSIKGGAGIFGMDALVKFAHDMETVLAALRSGDIQPDRPVLKALLRAADVLSDLVDGARDGRDPDRDRLGACAAELFSLVAGKEGAGAAGDDDLDPFDFTPLRAEFEPVEGSVTTDREWRILFRPCADLFRKANDPLLLFGELGRLGALTADLDEGAVPLLQDLNPEESYLSWTLRLRTASGEAAIREVFEFVEGDCDLAITAEVDPAASALPSPPVPTAQSSSATPVAVTAGSAATAPTIRVDLERVDRLIDLVSELVISEATLADRVSASIGDGHSELAAALGDLRQLTRDIQESVMAIRAQPVKSLFQRMSRLVREVEAITGKSVSLITAGDETEVDRAVIERLTDPLTHMIRNSIDHGIESPEARLAANKPAQGQVRISASHRAGRIVIEVVDDGGGIDRERVRAIAIERGLIGASDNLTDEEIDNLIFEPGFSTVAEASDLSGRGVGMDVVRRSIQALGGRISLSSRVGEGTRFSLSLPLTLAVMDGMLVTVCGQCLVVPLTALLETVQPKPGDVRRLGADTRVIAIRGAYVPLVALGTALNFRGAKASDGSGVALLVEDDAGERIALLVDDIVEQRQVVIKSLEANYRQTKGVAAATILGDGRVALIVDVNAIMASQRIRAFAHERQAVHA